MAKWIRGIVVLPLVFVAVLLSATFAYSQGGQVGIAGNSPLPTPTGGHSPLPTPTRYGTVPYPTKTPHRRPHRYPTATPTVSAPLYPELVRIDGAPLRKVIGDQQSSTLYAYTYSGWLYRSPDDGATWTLVTSKPAVDDFVMSSADPNVLYAGAGRDCRDASLPAQPMYRSLDGGLTWQRLPAGDNLRPLLAHPGDPAQAFAAGCDGPYLTIDGGLSWTARADTSPDALWETYWVVDMALLASPENAPPDASTWGALVVGAIAEDGSGALVFTNDVGLNWVRLTPNVFPASWGMNAVTAALGRQGLLAFAEPRTVWQTANYGINWQISSKGLEAVAQSDVAGGVYGLNDLLYHPADTLYLATVRGLYTKPFSGQVWSKVVGARYENTHITGLVFTLSTPNQIWLNTTDGVYLHQVR